RMTGDGVSTYLALTFGTLLSSQGTDASFVLTRENLSGFPPGASLRCFQHYQAFPVLLTTACGHAESDPEIGSDELDTAEARTRWIASLNLRQA
ncbi:hypothetical protein, partial [Streptomyces violaceorubidus]